MAQNRVGKKIKVAGSGLLGRALQHELDHLDGKLYIDYLDSMDELIPVGPGGRRGRGGPRGHERPGVNAADRRPPERPRSPDRRVGPRPDRLPRQRRLRRAGPAAPRGAPRGRARRRGHGAAAPGRPQAGPDADADRRAGGGAGPASPCSRRRGCVPRRPIAAILALAPELAVLADYGQIVPPALLDLPHGALNLHPSALPRRRGAAPIPATILAGRPRDGRDAHAHGRGTRHGTRRGARGRAAHGSARRHRTWRRGLAEIAAELLVRSLGPWLRGELPATPQPAEGSTLTRPLRREDGRLDPALPAAALERQVRAYLPWPGTFLELDGAAARRHARPPSAARSRATSQAPWSATDGARPWPRSDGRLVLDGSRPEGKRPMTGEDWLRGRRDRG